MSERDHGTQRFASGDRSHEECLSWLAEYAAASALDRQPELRYSAVAAHLARCASCRRELDELLALVEPAYAGQIEAAPADPQVDLSFLRRDRAGAGPDARPGHLVLDFSEALLAAIRRPTLAAGARGKPLFRYTPDPQPPGDLRLTVEVFAADELAKRGTIEVLVDVPTRDPLNQAGIRVTLSIGDVVFRGETGATGSVTFADISLSGLAKMRVEVEVPEAQA